MTGLPGLAKLVAIIAGIAALLSLVGEFARLTYIAQLARRMPEPHYVANALFLRWAYVISGSIMVVGGAIVGVLATTTAAIKPGPNAITGSCVMAIAGIGMVIFGFMFLRIQYNMQNAIRTQAQI